MANEANVAVAERHEAVEADEATYSVGGENMGATVSDRPAAPIRLDIGGGEHPRGEGWTLIDRTVGREAFPLKDYADNSVTEIYASHVLEHFPKGQVEAVLREWARVLAPGGRLRLSVPDLMLICAKLTEGKEDRDYLGLIYGGQTGDNDYHRSGFGEAGLSDLLTRAGLIGIRRWNPPEDEKDCSSLDVSLNLQAIKCPVGSVDRWKRHIVCVQTVPRLGFSANHRMHSELIARQGINTLFSYGVFWDQCIERGIEDAIEQGARWILTIDYDSVFNASIFERMCVLMEQYPEYDAIAPMQAMRGDDYQLLFNSDSARTLADLNADVIPVNHAHFGFTLLRASALKMLPHPWFMACPNDEGRWREGRKDADVAFWHKWREAGLLVGIAPNVGIGHIQENVVWVDRDLNRRYQQWHEFFNNGMAAPPGARA